MEILPRYAVFEVLERAFARGCQTRVRASDLLLTADGQMEAMSDDDDKRKRE